MQLEHALEQQDNNQTASSPDEVHPSASNDGVEQQDNNQTTSSPDEIHPSASNDGVEQSSAEHATVDSTDLQQTLSLATNKQTDSVNGDHKAGHRRRSKRNKSSRLQPLKAIWNVAIKPFEKDEPLSLEQLRIAEQESWKADIKLPMFDWDTVAAATNNFSSSGVIASDEFGSVYKALLPSGEAVAVKRHLGDLTYSLKTFRNEIDLLPDLQHRNIIKLLGFCKHREELLLVYEFMENRSLDKFIGDNQQQHLPWAVRNKIIMGIARGLVYLHQDSGLRLIHMNITPEHILLDIGMNPKISGFRSARTLVGHELEMTRSASVCATIGYAPSEHWWYIISRKTDVYSFGVVLLQIVSGREVVQQYKHLTVQAKDLWKEGKALELVDSSLGFMEFPPHEAQTYIQVALLCTQENPFLRPSMLSVVQMLEGSEKLTQPLYPFEPDDILKTEENTEAVD